MKLGISPVSVMNFFLMLGLSIIFAVDDKLFSKGSSDLYEFYLDISPQIGYALATFSMAVLFFAAFVFKNRNIEIAGLFGSGIFTLIILSGYLLGFPNIGSILLAVWTLATFMTIANTVNILQDEKERKNI
ncbi:MAG: hypothetical protein ACE3JQ_00190 [Paenisporosarcina sp.]